MNKARMVLGMAFATVLAVGMNSVVAAQSPDDDGKKAEAKSVTTARAFAVLEGVKAEPMAASELKAVKGLHIHFTTPSENPGPTPDDGGLTGWHLVNFKENNLGKGQALSGSGPGYSGLCGAALLSPALTIPFQNPTTGSGGGC